MTSAAILLTVGACTGDRAAIGAARDVTPPEINRSNTDTTDARNNSPSAASAPAAPSTSTSNIATPNASTSQDAYRSSHDAYKAALAKAKEDHKTAVESCNALDKSARKSCKDTADSQLNIAKSEANKLKPTS